MRLHRVIKVLVLICCLMFIYSEIRAQVNLLNIQKGAEGKKAWMILTFDKSVALLGVSKQEYNVISMYLRCLTRDYDNSVISISDDLNRKIRVKQINTDPMIAKFDIVCNDGVPLSVLRKDRYIVISMESDKLVSAKSSISSMDMFEYEGRLVDVYNETKQSRSVTTLKFEGDYKWTGFFQPSPEKCELFVTNAILLTSEDEYLFRDNPLTRVQLAAGEDSDKTIIDLTFKPLHGYSIFDINKEITIRTDRKQTIFPEAAQEKEDKPKDDIVTIEQADTEGVTLESLFIPEEKALKDKEEKVTYKEPVREEKPKKEPVRELVTPSYEEEVQKKRDEIKHEPEPSRIPWDAKLPSMNFRSAPLKDVLRTIADPFNLNLLIDEQVDDSITFRLSDITLRQAFDKLLHTHNCEYYVDEDIIIVKPIRVSFKGGFVTEVFKLEYADANNIAEVIGSMVSSDSLIKIYHNEFLSEKVGLEGRQQSNEQAIQGIRRSSVIVITERPEKLEQIRRVINNIDIQPVLFEINSKLVEAAPEDKSKLGINWDKTLSAILTNQFSSGSSETGSEGLSGINTNPGSIGPLQLASLNTSQYEAVIDFLREKTDSQLKSRPSIIAMDNEEASISVGTTVPIPQIQRGMGGTGDMVTFEYKEVNIQLNVTAHLGKNDNVIMYVNPVIEEITDWVVYENQRAPITSKRSVNTFVSVKSGQTIVIGGLVKSKKVKKNNKVWLLGNIPLIGKLFQSEEYEFVQSDVLIFITPTVVKY
ncbi:MAG: secretin N-terminal domain-containing protein [bacterium]